MSANWSNAGICTLHGNALLGRTQNCDCRETGYGRDSLTGSNLTLVVSPLIYTVLPVEGIYNDEVSTVLYLMQVLWWFNK